MTYLSFWYYVFVVALVAVYYMFPLKHRWTVLLAGSLGFYYMLAGNQILAVLAVAVWSYVFAGLFIKVKTEKIRKWLLITAVLGTVLPWIVIKNGEFLLTSILGKETIRFVAPLGISFYTLQVIAYLVAVYRQEVKPQTNFAKYVLFVTFFPQIVQGPIPRYHELEKDLYKGHCFEEKKFVGGVQLIIWGFFLKLVIANKAAVIANTVFSDYITYGGSYIWVAGILYSIELYADFLACITLSQGVAELFGISLKDNFARPYFAVSIKDFWRRWHISLSNWLRDYIYIPLGGNRKGKFKKYVFLGITFAISGMWHGAGYKYLVWGMLQAVYQTCGDLTKAVREKIYAFLRLTGTKEEKVLKWLGTMFWLLLSMIVFGADSLRGGVRMLQSMFTVYNPWIFFDDSLLGLGLDWKECIVLLGAMLILLRVSTLQEQGKCIRQEIDQRHLITRWSLYLLAIICIMTFGTYGSGYNAQNFIYGGF